MGLTNINNKPGNNNVTCQTLQVLTLLPVGLLSANVSKKLTLFKPLTNIIGRYRFHANT
jgi:hypothetical protein